MNGYVTNIEDEHSRTATTVVCFFTGSNIQLVLMTLQPGDEIGLEQHEGHDQFIRIEAGTGVAEIDGKKHALRDGVALVIPSGAKHNVRSQSRCGLHALQPAGAGGRHGAPNEGGRFAALR